MDGMDPVLLKEMMDAGRMPNFSKLAAQGTFKPLGTSMPPQSPVAWSNFISGALPDTHQIYDFIHRDPNPPEAGLVVKPYLSTSETIAPASDKSIAWGQWRIPLSGGQVKSMRQGGAFWDLLVARGIPTAIYRVPANYPPPDVKGPGDFCCLCGMGTPDLLGTYGEFTQFTSDAKRSDRTVGGGKFVYLDVHENRAWATLEGPENFLHQPGAGGRAPHLTTPLEIVRDPQAKVVKIRAGEQLLLLNEGEWSDWVRVRFETGIPGATALGAMQLPTALDAIVRFYLKSTHPHLELYVTPLNIDPANPANPISTPHKFAGKLAQACGPYYTTGIPEDTQALRNGAFSEDEFLAQCRLLLDERIKQYRYALKHFDGGCLFFYFGSTDQLAHIFWRDRDPGHPGRDPKQGDRYAKVIEDCYVEMDGLVGEALAALRDDDTMLILSDHGFASFRRGFNVNTWLIQNGYMKIDDPEMQDKYQNLTNVDWSQTRAYALGINSLYVNLAGREKKGLVQPGAARTALLKEIAEKLLTVRDRDGAVVIDKVYLTDEIYPKADPRIAPDLLIGYARNYRGSWATALGGTPKQLLEDNLDRWSGDHCMAAHLVPGILVTNRKITVADPNLTDLAPTILRLFRIDKPAEMIGRPLF